MSSLRRARPPSRAAGRGALALSLILGLAACATTPAVGSGAAFVLTTRGDYLQADSPPGVEVTLGARRVRRADEPAALD